MLDYTNLFSPNKYEKNDKIILKYFQWLKRFRWEKSIVLFVIKYNKFKNPKILYTFEKTLVISIICIKCGNEDEKIFQEESTEIPKILGFIKNI